MKQEKNYQLLFQYPTRGRREKFFNTLDEYYKKIKGENFIFHVVIDDDDEEMNKVEVLDRIREYKYMHITHSRHANKIIACNDMALINKINDYKWDIVICCSDDMMPIVDGFDNVIRAIMRDYFPDTDGVLWFNDGFQRKRLNTLPIIGRNYYDRFGYIYYWGYKNIYCDAEFTEVSKILNKCVYFDDIIIKHEHPETNSSIVWDETYKRGEKYNEGDRILFEARKKKNFDL